MMAQRPQCTATLETKQKNRQTQEKEIASPFHIT